jgi:hypothetical protein
MKLTGFEPATICIVGELATLEKRLQIYWIFRFLYLMSYIKLNKLTEIKGIEEKTI